MKQQELVSAVSTLHSLKQHYSSQYEEYMAKALAAKANIDRLDILIDDLSKGIKNQGVLKPIHLMDGTQPLDDRRPLDFSSPLLSSVQPQQVDNSASLPSTQEEKSFLNDELSTQIELDFLTQSNEEDTEDVEISDKEAEKENIFYSEFLDFSPIVMPILKSIFTEERGKKLHISYLHKAVNKECLLNLNQEIIGTLLDKAIFQGYCERDIHDKDCYFSVTKKSDNNDNSYEKIFELFTTHQDDENSQKQEEEIENKIPSTKRLHSLPPAPGVKITILDTILGYIHECEPKSFTHKDVINYLYSTSEQASWSKELETTIISSISQNLRRNSHQKWKTILTGVYEPVIPNKPKNSVSLTEIEQNHSLPPSPHVKITLPDTILGYIYECQPKTFNNKDVVNYLYSKSEQASWSKNQKSQVIASISNTLYKHNNKKWKRIRTGVYKPLIFLEPKKSLSVKETESTHNWLPSPKIKMNLFETIMGYIEECQPKTFNNKDVLNYLYSEEDRKEWTEEQSKYYLVKINSLLGYYSNKNYFLRVRNGVYQPLSN